MKFNRGLPQTNCNSSKEKHNCDSTMASQIQQNLEQKNAQYASSFKEGHLALPPAKKYAVGRSLIQAQLDSGKTEPHQ